LLPDFRIRQRDYLLEILQAITQELDLDNVLARILKISIEMLAGQAGLISLRDPQDGWRVMVSQGITNAFLRQLQPIFSEMPEVEETAINELSRINRLLQRMTNAASLGLITSVALPLVARHQVIGVLFIFRNYLGVFSTNDKRILQSFADQAAIAVRNAQLYTRLRQEEQRTGALIDSVADGIIILASDHMIEHCNPALSHMLGIPTNEILGKDHEEVIRFAKREDGLSLEQAEAGGWPLTPNATLYVEGDLIRHDKLPIPVGVTYAPLLSPEGNLLNIIASVRDITRFREAEELKSTFISVVSHELKTPVALIKGYVSTLRREDARWDREIVQDSLEVIEEEADRLTSLIDNLLDASRLQAGALAINLCDVALDTLVKRVVEKFQTQTEQHTIKIDFADKFPIILGDEDRLTQVLNNLIQNAIKYSSDGGEIIVSGQIRPTQVIICVRDDGPGIAVEDIPHIFDRFYRASEASKTTKGAGLGLYLAKAVIEAHKGRIWVDPKPGDGARICFSLPRDE